MVFAYIDNEPWSPAFHHHPWTSIGAVELESIVALQMEEAISGMDRALAQTPTAAIPEATPSTLSTVVASSLTKEAAAMSVAAAPPPAEHESERDLAAPPGPLSAAQTRSLTASAPQRERCRAAAHEKQVSSHSTQSLKLTLQARSGTPARILWYFWRWWRRISSPGAVLPPRPCRGAASFDPLHARPPLITFSMPMPCTLLPKSPKKQKHKGHWWKYRLRTSGRHRRDKTPARRRPGDSGRALDVWHSALLCVGRPGAGASAFLGLMGTPQQWCRRKTCNVGGQKR